MSREIVSVTWGAADANLTANAVRAVILCDTAADLPAPTDFSDYVLLTGSVAHVIDQDINKMLDSAGNWHDYNNLIGGLI